MRFTESQNKRFLGFEVTDDASASASYDREVDVEQEIQRMEKERQECSQEASQSSHPGLFKNRFLPLERVLESEAPQTHLDLNAVGGEIFDDDDFDDEELEELETQLESKV